MDNNYFVLRVSKENHIEIYFYNFNSFACLDTIYPICFITPLVEYKKIIHILSICKIINNCSTAHKFYLGKEIFKAQLAFKLNQDYIQD